MSTISNENVTKRSPTAGSRDTDDLANQIAAIRADLQNLTGTVSRIASKQVNRAQDKAVDVANDVEDAIRRNPLHAIAMALGLGFVFGVFTRR